MYIQCFNGSLGIWGIPDTCAKFGGNSSQKVVRDFEWIVCTICCCQANELDSTLFTMEHVPIFVSPTLYSVFYTPRVSFFSSIQLYWFFRLKKHVYKRSGRAQHLETAATSADDMKRHFLMNINYAMCRLLSWLAERQRSYQINESNSAEVLLMNIN